jgi:RimJ/RimL family protein N-acetyltransferase
VRTDGAALIAYELHSRYWGRGFGSSAVDAMIGELSVGYGVHMILAVLKARNHRSLALLRRLAFTPADAVMAASCDPEHDEIVMARAAQQAGEGS